MDYSPPRSSVPGISQARMLERVAISFSNVWKWKVKAKSLSKCPTLCDPMDCSLPGSSIHGIFQARVLDWVAIAFSNGCESWTIKKSWAPKNWCFWTVVLESPLDYKEIQPVLPKGDQSWIFIGRTDVEAETPILLPGKSHGWRSLVGCCLWGCTELDTTEVT